MERSNQLPVFRRHYRAQLASDGPVSEETVLACRRNAEKMLGEGRLMTCGLYVYGRQLFLYAELVGEDCPPDTFMAPLAPLLSPWPHKEETVRWARMYLVFYHRVPRDAEDWKRETPPARRRGRIAYLKEDKLFSYVYHHTALVREGLLKGDKYMSVALHEDVLFSYFEEPRSSVNLMGTEEESRAIEAWTAADPESHFIHLPGSEGANFLLLPALFDLG